MIKELDSSTKELGGLYIMVRAIVGACWGDEGKGKITDMLAEQSDVVIR